MTNEQLQQLIAAIQPQQPQRQQKSAAVLGHIKTLDLGCEKMRKLKKFNEWLEEAENRMVYIGANTDEEKVTLLRSWGGTDFVNFMKLNAKVLFEPTRAVLEPEGEEQEVPPRAPQASAGELLGHREFDGKEARCVYWRVTS